MASVGERLRTRRWNELRYRQADTAAAAGLSPARLSELERDVHRVGEPALRRLAAVLGLDPDDLVAHARREDRLARQLPSRGDRAAVPPGPPPEPVPPRGAPVPSGTRWLTTAEAGAVLGLTPNAVAVLLRRGALAPAERRRMGTGPSRWVVAAAAVRAYAPQEPRRRPRGPRPVPAGYRSLGAFAAAAGLSSGALHRRVAAGAIESVRIGRRRLIPERALARWLAERDG